MTFRILATTLAVLAFAPFSPAQQNLTEMVQDGGVEWMIGKWSGQTDNGSTVSLSYTWDLNQHVILTHLKGSDMEVKGTTFVDPESGQPKYFGVDDAGRVSSGTWDAENGDSILRYEGKRADGSARKGGVRHKKVDANTMKVEMHALGDWDELVEPARFSITLTRQK